MQPSAKVEVCLLLPQQNGSRLVGDGNVETCNSIHGIFYPKLR